MSRQCPCAFGQRQSCGPVLWRQPDTRATVEEVIDVEGSFVGHTDHKPWPAREIGPVGVAMLRGVKNAVDPTGVLNPGVMMPE